VSEDPIMDQGETIGTTWAATPRRPGLTRRSLLGAAVTSVIAGSTAARLLQRVGQDELDRAGGLGALGLVVAQHELRTDTVGFDDLRRAQAVAGAIDPFVLLGVSVDEAAVPDHEVEAWTRTRGEAGWGEWHKLVFSADEGPDPAEVGAVTRRTSQALWVGWADAVEIELPAGMVGTARVHLVRETPVVLAHHDDTIPASTSRAPQPSIRSRSAWNARPFKGTPTIASKLDVAIVHHSAGGNGYSAGEVPGIIAAIQRFHMDTNGWNDIAYNFMVDRFGQLWEARQGGITRAVVGGHSAGSNTGSTGICLLGSYDGITPPKVAIDAIAAWAAWKLGVHGIDVSTSVVFNGATRNRIIGHRDVRSTACPGGRLYPQLGEIRQQAFVRQGGFPDVPVTSYYAEPVAWLTLNGITTGVGNTGLYKPDDVVTRAQMVAFLWRLMGSPPESRPHRFPDVGSSTYYEPAVRWARATGVTDGVGNTGRFEPDDPVTRAQMAAFLHRLAGSSTGHPGHGFPDVSSSSYYDEAVRWAKRYGITDGVGNTGRYMPGDRVTRAQMAAFLHRLAGIRSAWASGTPLPAFERW
jgi:hypothetical protein